MGTDDEMSHDNDDTDNDSNNDDDDINNNHINEQTLKLPNDYTLQIAES